MRWNDLSYAASGGGNIEIDDEIINQIVEEVTSELPGKSSEGENSVIFGSSSNEFSEVVLPENVYYKPIIEEFIEYVETNKIYSDGTMWGIGVV